MNATIGFGELARRTGKTDKNLILALGPNGSPTAANLFQIILACMKAEGVTVAAHVIRPGERVPAGAWAIGSDRALQIDDLLDFYEVHIFW